MQNSSSNRIKLKKKRQLIKRFSKQATFKRVGKLPNKVNTFDVILFQPHLNKKSCSEPQLRLKHLLLRLKPSVLLNWTRIYGSHGFEHFEVSTHDKLLWCWKCFLWRKHTRFWHAAFVCDWLCSFSYNVTQLEWDKSFTWTKCPADRAMLFRVSQKHS